jgi:predicted aldo/keto reductase-like oxidoreductase
VAACGALSLDDKPVRADAKEDPKKKPGIRQFRLLGRTGFKVSDISFGGAFSDSNVIRYGYDRGVNFIDTAESYGKGESERMVGGAMKHMDRKKIFIVTKLGVKKDEKKASIISRFKKCLERMKTDYADALYLHGPDNASEVKHKAFHAAAKKLKADGRLRHVGISNHGPRSDKEDSMEKVLLAAVEDGRFDLMLLSYNFMNKEEGERVLWACREKNIGTTCMKAAPGAIKIEPFDPKNPSKKYADLIKRYMVHAKSREEAIEWIKKRLERTKAVIPKSKPFVARYGIQADDELKKKSIQWVLNNPDMHTVCVAMRDFDLVDKFVPLSGTRLSKMDQKFLDDYRLAYGDQYCRHGCRECVSSCPHRLPVSTIMRYAYYFQLQGREKLAMQKYADLAGRDASLCFSCPAPCADACPHGVSITANLITAHSLLSLA